jgi:TonB family protein
MTHNRRHARQLVTPPVYVVLYVVLDGSSSGGVLYDLGEGGLAVDIIGSKLTGEQVLLEFDMPETGRRFEAAGQITWKNEPGNRVGLRFVDLSHASNLQIKEWLSAKSSSGEFSQNAEFPDLSMEAGPPEHPPPQRETTTEPIASRWFEPVAKAQPPDPIYTGSPTLVPSDSVPIAPQAPASGALAQDDGDRVMRDLRSALSQSEVARRPKLDNEITPEQVALDRQRRHKWIFVAALVFVEVLVLAVGTWFYVSQDWTKGAAFERVKAIVASAFSSSTAAPPPAPISHPSRSKAGRRRPPEEAKSQGSKQTTSSADVEPGEGNKTPATSQFEVLDAQNGRRYLLRTSTSVKVQFERQDISESKNTSSNEPRLTASAPAEPASAPLPNAHGSELGRVSQQSSGELPTVQVMPEYPTLALQKNVRGRVILKAVISKDGTLQNVRLVSPPSPLNSTVLDAVRKWRYQPHYEKGEAVEVETQIIVDFSITAK